MTFSVNTSDIGADINDDINACPVGVFDSGLGGLTVARAIAHALPHESVYYFGDTKRCPYGVRTEDQVRSFTLQAGRWLAHHSIKILVIACNTATAAALRIAQQTLDVPVIGVIAPGARAAINSTRTRKVGVLAVTIGMGVERELKRLSLTDHLGQVLFDAAATTMVERAADAAEATAAE